MVEIIKDILPTFINKKIIYLLLDSCNWRIAKDEINHEQLLEDLLYGEGKDYGNSLQSYDELHKINLQSPLNLYAEIVFEIVKKRTKHKFTTPHRFYWNYYNNSSNTELHRDRNENNYVSLVYNLHDNDGGTEINGVFYKSNGGEAILFPSNCLHKGLPPVKTKGRFNLNIIANIDTECK
jgi:hypothetical protein